MTRVEICSIREIGKGTCRELMRVTVHNATLEQDTVLLLFLTFFSLSSLLKADDKLQTAGKAVYEGN